MKLHSLYVTTYVYLFVVVTPAFEIAVTVMVCEPTWVVGNVPPLDKVVVPVTALHEEIPDTGSAQVKVAASGWLSTYTALLVGLVIETVGARVVDLDVLIGPAVAQLPTLSHTDTELVETLGLLVPPQWAASSA